MLNTITTIFGLLQLGVFVFGALAAVVGCIRGTKLTQAEEERIMFRSN
ncbi:hypothetical protein [uncultured Paludibaculum sp.]|nr:hypothetical protein [uncultured Paludibaculum sp.]